MQNDLHIPLARSTLLALLLLAAHLLTLAIIWQGDWPILWHLAGKAAVLLSLLHQLDRAGWLREGRRPVSLHLSAAERQDGVDHVEVAFADGRRQGGPILAGSVVMPFCVIIRFAVAKDASRQARRTGLWPGSARFLVACDAVPPEALRQLRVRLRWGRHAPV